MGSEWWELGNGWVVCNERCVVSDEIGGECFLGCGWFVLIVGYWKKLDYFDDNGCCK